MMLNQKNQDIFFVLKKTPQAKNDSFLSSCAFNVEEKKVTIVSCFFYQFGEKMPNAYLLKSSFANF